MSIEAKAAVGPEGETEIIWADVERAAAPVALWPSWKKLGSGLLDSKGNALPPSTIPGPF